ncbi:MAG: prepilin peptidase [Thermodesulfobacteriota bacterium]
MLSTDILTYIVSFILGSVVGSFLNVCIYRIPREESIVHPGSHCTSCGSPIRFYNNIPILSYFFLKGRCTDCGANISKIYPIVELITGLLFFATVYYFGITIEALFYLILFSALLVITFIDIEHLIIPNVITYPGILVGLVFGALRTNLETSLSALESFSVSFYNFFELLRQVPILDSIFGIIVGGAVLLIVALIYQAYKKRQGIGIGDVKLLAMIGAFFGWEGVLFTIFLASIVGSAVGISIIIAQKGDLKYQMPFGPFLSIAAVIYAFTGGFKLFL